MIAFRWAEGHYDRLPVLAAELVDLRVAALFAAGGPPSALAAKAATRPFPSYSRRWTIRSASVSFPVSIGLAATSPV